MQKPLYIFDIDGTLALIDHRRHFVTKPVCPHCEGQVAIDRVTDPSAECDLCYSAGTDPSFKPDWDAFHKACVADLPNWPVINVLNDLYLAGAQILLFSGRSAVVYDETVDWLERFLDIDRLRIIESLKMRPEGDFTPDEVLKKQWLDQLPESDRKRLNAVFDDRDKVVRMWRQNGVACFQVAPGEF